MNVKNELPRSKSYGVSKTARNEESFGEYDPERFNPNKREAQGKISQITWKAEERMEDTGVSIRI
jgi:hypothetical protein